MLHANLILDPSHISPLRFFPDLLFLANFATYLASLQLFLFFVYVCVFFTCLLFILYFINFYFFYCSFRGHMYRLRRIWAGMKSLWKSTSSYASRILIKIYIHSSLIIGYVDDLNNGLCNGDAIWSHKFVKRAYYRSNCNACILPNITQKYIPKARRKPLVILRDRANGIQRLRLRQRI